MLLFRNLHIKCGPHKQLNLLSRFTYLYIRFKCMISHFLIEVNQTNEKCDIKIESKRVVHNSMTCIYQNKSRFKVHHTNYYRSKI